jgi:putative ABC transport system substrate-binding protein
MRTGPNPYGQREPRGDLSRAKVSALIAQHSVLCFALSAMLFALCIPAQAQQTKKIPKIGYLTNDFLAVDAPRRNAFRQGLRDLGYVEGQSIVIEYRVGEGRIEKLAELADELVRLKVDAIFAFTTSGAQAAKNATKEIPIVMGANGDPVALGFVESLARPGRNITGLVTNAGAEIYGKQLELLKEAVPKTTRVAVLWNPANAQNLLQLKETRAAASGLGVTLLSFEAKEPNDIDTAFATMKKERAGALTVLPDPMLLGQRQKIADLAAKHRLPAIYGIPEHMEAGGLMAYAANRLDIFRRAATYVDKILKGAKPADLPVEQPTKFEFIINLKAAKQIGLTIPPNVLARADRVIR